MAKVLLVEDDNNLREIYEARLQAEGYSIVSAKDGEEALVVAKQEKPDLIISDVMMPKISGFEMLDILRNTDGIKDTKVIMLTALGQTEDQTRADNLGADRYLVKSQVTLEDIVKVSHELLGESTTEDNQAQSTDETAATAAPDPEPVQTQAPVTQEPVAQEPVAAPAPVTPAPEVVMPTSPDPEPVQTQAPVTPAPEPVTPEPAIAPVTNDPVPPPQPVQDQATPPSNNTPNDVQPLSISADGQLAQTEAEENAVMDQQVNAFLQNTPAETPESTNSTNDQTLAQAVNNLMNVSENANPAEPSLQPVAQEESPATPTAQPSSGGQKVIQPLGPAPQKSLDELVKQEEAKEQASTQTTANPQPPMHPFDPSDPNSISL